MLCHTAWDWQQRSEGFFFRVTFVIWIISHNSIFYHSSKKIIRKKNHFFLDLSCKDMQERGGMAHPQTLPPPALLKVTNTCHFIKGEGWSTGRIIREGGRMTASGESTSDKENIGREKNSGEWIREEELTQTESDQGREEKKLGEIPGFL